MPDLASFKNKEFVPLNLTKPLIAPQFKKLSNFDIILGMNVICESSFCVFSNGHFVFCF